MYKILFLAVVLLSAVYAQAAEEKYTLEWRNCTNDSDCILIEGPCGEWEAMGKVNADKAKNWYKSTASKVDCMSPPFLALKYRAVCENNTCTTKTEKDPDAYKNPPGLLNTILPGTFPYNHKSSN